MADAKLTALTAAGALAAADLFYVSQSAASRKATGTQLLALVGTAYVPLAGGTMTGALTLPAGSASAPSLMFTVAGATTGIYSAGSNDISFAVNGSRRGYFNVSTMWVDGALGLLSDTGLLRFGSGSASDPTFFRAGVGTIYLRPASTTTACSLYISGLYTDSSNYERLNLSTTAGSSVNITAESLGTGASNLDVVITAKGAGGYKFGTAGSPVFSVSSIGTTTLYSTITTKNINCELSLRMPSNDGVRFSSTTNPTGPQDAAIFRGAPGQIDITDSNSGTYRDLKLRNLLNTEYHQMTEMTAPSAPATNSVRIYAEDNGSGKTRLMALFATGAAQQIAIEP